MKIILFAFILFLFFTQATKNNSKGFLKEAFENDGTEESEEDDFKKSFSVICRDKGYPFETHKVLTEDGYWLTVFRIPGKKGETREEAVTQNKPVIFLQHGILDSADTWIMNYEAEAPAFLLANEGYDVWLGNTRGNKYSREHQSLNPDDKTDGEKFFDFSFEEMAKYDVVGNIEYILDTTGKKKLGVMAHSQGTTQMFIRMQDDISWWNENVEVFTSLAGVARLDHCGSKLLTTLASGPFLVSGIRRLGIYEMFPAQYLENAVFSRVCKILPVVCDIFIQMISDEDAGLDNQKRISNFMGHYPAGTSLKSLDHFAQIVRAKKFQKYDYGSEKNMEVYGQKTSPEYDLSKVKETKIIQIYGSADLLADPQDSAWLNEQLGSNVIHYEEYKLGHMSFLLANDMQYFHDVIKILAENKWE
mmetsp:Transcript_2133/g.2435  ORF Transcript_2133/g.2435 Transcript_2133/m.2435 type:complete len:418 (-) Transcript_2133:81-1334(-)|eukprot:CAMPEP_0205833574 /NCGR_PEP_ID=MMETSP0206-20130828/50092_1 /ASSEMBLY_ACC=CAM_ASM_000279 /TAXON_ID=36767 /ORGANISM="Euplotes focardii, Strain TN1" /LENGTH=417 /DNA_ID=CAMNT_0053140113 /DNA_START=16 /DNA_END=1269 /DNA_ORIENTATION=+